MGSDLLNEAGFNGANQAACIIDSGIDYRHEALGDCNTEDYFEGNCKKVIGGYNFIDNNIDVFETSLAHGTKVAGIVAADGDYPGLAKSSNIVMMKSVNYDNVKTNFNRINQSINWCVSNRDTYNVSVIIITYAIDGTFVSRLNCDFDFYHLQSAIDSAVENGIGVFIASGNNGFSRIQYPSCLNNVISVGGSLLNDEVWDDTSRDPTLSLMAPYIIYKTTDVDKKYTNTPFIIGTSFSAPLAAGASILIKDFDTGLTQHDINNLLIASGKKVKINRIILPDYYVPRIDLASATGALDWPTFNHDNRRTGFTILKGDLEKNNNQKEVSYSGNPSTDFWDNPVLADIDNDDEMEIVVSTCTYCTSEEHGKGRVFALDTRFGEEEWSTTKTLPHGEKLIPTEAPTVIDIDGDGNKEVIFGTVRKGLFILNARNGHLIEHFGPIVKGGLYSSYYAVAVADVDADGEKEIIFNTYYYDGSIETALNPIENLYHQSTVYVYGYQKGKLNFKWKKDIDGTFKAGSQENIAIANLDGTTDPYQEIVLATPTKIVAFDGKTGTKQLTFLINGTSGTPTISDLDRDGEYEIIVSTSSKYDYCQNITCSNSTYLIDPEGNKILGFPHGTWMPEGSHAVANLIGDDHLEIVMNLQGSHSSNIGKVTALKYSGTSFTSGWAYPESIYTYKPSGSPSIADIDKDGDFEVITVLGNRSNGTTGNVLFLSNEGEHKWNISTASGMWSSPAIGDFDGEKDAELAVVHRPYTQSQFLNLMNNRTEVWEVESDGPKIYRQRRIDMTVEEYEIMLQEIQPMEEGGLAVYGGLNKAPQINALDDQVIIEGESLQLSVSASDPNNDSVVLDYGYPLNSTGGVETITNNHSGEYYVSVIGSDGNLSSAEYFDLTILRHDATKESEFNDSTEVKEYTFSTPGSQTMGLTVPNQSRTWIAKLKLSGMPIGPNSTAYQEPSAQVIQSNEINTSTAATYAVDKDWDTYYSAGTLTGMIGEISSLTIPQDSSHIIVHVKLRVFGSGNGRFALYNYNEDYYEVVTSTLPATNESYQDVYFDIFDGNNSLWATNASLYSMEVDSIQDFINSSSIRWYYRYINGDYAS